MFKGKERFKIHWAKFSIYLGLKDRSGSMWNLLLKRSVLLEYFDSGLVFVATVNVLFCLNYSPIQKKKNTHLIK